MTARRTFIMSSIAAAASVSASAVAAGAPDGPRTHGLIGRMSVKPGQRDAVITILIEGTAAMPGCLSYVIAEDSTDADGIWITEVWDSERSHDASLTLPSVRDAITRARPLITGFGDRHVTTPRGGTGMAKGA